MEVVLSPGAWGWDVMEEEEKRAKHQQSSLHPKC